MNDRENDAASKPARSGISKVWAVLVLIACAGSLALGILAYMLWRTGRVPGVRTLPAAPGAIAVFEGSFPAGGADPLVSPRGITSYQGRIYVVEPDAARVSAFALDGRLVGRVPVSTTDTVYPVALAVLKDEIYLADAAGGGVLAVPIGGGPVRRIDSGLTQPTALAAAGDHLIIGDAASGLIRLDPATGKAVPIAPDARFFAGGIARTRDGRVLVSDATGSRLRLVDARNGDARTFGERVNLPRGLAVDGAGRVWVADVLGGTVAVFDRAGQRLGDLASESISGPDRPGLVAPEGVVYVDDVNRLYVTDARLGRVFAFGIRR